MIPSQVKRFKEEICGFLAENGVNFEDVTSGDDSLPVVLDVTTLTQQERRHIVLLPVCAASPSEASSLSDKAGAVIAQIRSREGVYPLIITQDRWNRRREMMQKRLLAHLETHVQVYARNCEIRRIDKPSAAEFLEENHSYGDAACRYRYGMYLKRHTGHIASQMRADGDDGQVGKLIAVATFSNGRKWVKSGKEIRSYEWTRYASLPRMRISGGMGRMLKAFIKDVEPDDIMSYADLEWSEGDVYESLGFVREEGKEPVMFTVDPLTWERAPVRQGQDGTDAIAGSLFYRNFGSGKYRLKLTEYK